MRIDSFAPCLDQSNRPTDPRHSVHDRDPAFAARPRLVFLHRALAAEARKAGRRTKPGVPPLFFFDPVRQTEFEAARTADGKAKPHPIEALTEEVLPDLFASVETRRAARAIPGLKEAAVALAAKFPGAKELADLLAVPDDEMVLVLHPARRAGYRLLVRGVADVAQFHVLLAKAITRESLPAGVPMVVTPLWQMFRPAAILSDGTLPVGVRGCPHWLWGTEPLASVPRVDGERVILLGEPTVRSGWDVERHFPAMDTEVRLVEVLNPFVVAERLGRLAGQPVPVRAADERPRQESRRAA